jgi:hypothetical protein
VMVTSSPPVMMMTPAIVQVPNSAVMAPVPGETTTSTNWGNGATEQNRTTQSADGSVQKQTTTTWNENNDAPSETTTTTTNPY